MQKTTLFVAACCCWPHTPDTGRNIERAAAEISDWDEAKQVAIRHRVSPLVHQAVKDVSTVPEDFRAWAKRSAQAVAQHAMQLTRECIKIDGAFKTEGLQALHFKGPVLAQLAYGSVALKHSRDLDIFVKEDDVGAAAAILEATGYRVVGQDGPVSARQLAAMLRNFKDMGFVDPKGTLIEIHWRFVHFKSLLAGLEKGLHRQEVTVANAATLETFGSVQMLRYLCIHGASHHWYRLKWLADLSAFLNQLPSQERTQVIALVSAGKESDACAQALKLCDTLFGTTYAPPMSRRAEALYQHALARIDQPYVPPKSLWGDVGFLRDCMARRHLFPTPLAAIGGLRGHSISQTDVLTLPLPTYLNGLYPILRLPSLLLRRLRSYRTLRPQNINGQ